MTVSFMHCCKRLLSALLRGVLLFGWLTCAYAEGIYVNKAELRRAEDGYHLTATYDIGLTRVMQQALSRGIPLYFIGEFSLTRPRWYWMNEEVFEESRTSSFPIMY